MEKNHFQARFFCDCLFELKYSIYKSRKKVIKVSFDEKKFAFSERR